MQPIRRILLKLTIVFLLVAALFCSGLNRSAAYAAPCTANTLLNLWAKTGTATLYGSTSVTIWGYSLTSGGAATLPGPVLQVNQGDCVQVTLHNTLAEPSALLFQGQSLIPDTTGAAATTGTKVYTFAASKPGTFLYEAGLIRGKQHQVAMGLYGALIVQPTIPAAVSAEKTLVLSEFDTTLAANPVGYDMRKYAPKYFLINGKAYPDTNLAANQITVNAGSTTLLRYVNAGLQAHAMSSLGIAQKAIATDGSAFAHPHSMVSETIAPGQTLDALVTIPASAAAGTKYALYDANLLLRNATASGLGGMLTFLTVGTAAPPADTGPFVSSPSLSPNPTGGAAPAPVTVKATISDAGTVTVHTIAAAEFYIDSTAGTAYPMSADDAAFDGPTEAVTSASPISTAMLQALASGSHTIYIRGRDSSNTWSSFQPITLNLDKTGPASSALTLSPNPSSGAVAVSLTATGNDTAAGNSNVTAAEYWVDSGAHTAMTAVGVAAPNRGFTATISAGLAQGTHVVSVRSQDSFGNWGAASTINLVVGDTMPPSTSGVSASPNPNNGSTPYNTSVLAVRVVASFSDVATGNSNIATAEGFIDTVGTTGTGFVFVATDGLFNSPTESGYADVPLPVINALSTGTHNIYVHAKDAAGNWGATATTVLLIDKTAPTFTSITLTPNTILPGAASVNLAVNGATDTGGAGLAGGEYWINPPTTAAPAPGSGTQFSGTTATIPTSSLTAGSYTISVRIRDAAGNWSTGTNGIRSAPLYAIQAVNDARAITANTNASQTSDATAAAGVLTNDQPTGVAGRTARIASAPVRTSGTGAGTITVTCPSSLGTAATPSIGGNTVCTNGAYRVTLNGTGTSGAARQASKRGIYQFTYTLILNGVTSTATVTITVN